MLGAELFDLWVENRGVYRVRKLWKTARRAGLTIGCGQTARLARALCIEGVKRARRVKTTTPDLAATRHPDLVKPDFTATAPNQLWVTDLKFVPTWVGAAYVCFIINAFSRTIVGWRVALHMQIETVLDAIGMARWQRGKHMPGLRLNLDVGGRFTLIRYGERLAEVGAFPWIGTVGDGLVTALAETVNGYYKAELVRGPDHRGPCKTVRELELATFGWVH